MPTSISIRLGVEGGADVRRTLEDVGKAGQSAFDRTKEAADRAGAATDRQTERNKRLAQAAREAEAQARAQARINDLLGVRDMSTGGARASASAFEAELARREQMEVVQREQAARSSQANINRLLGIQEIPTRDARSSASVFEEQFRREAEIRSETIRTIMVRQAAQARATDFRSGLDQRLGVRTEIGSSGRADDIAAYGAELERVRARFVPLAGAAQSYRKELTDIAQAAKTGAINENERAEAVRRTKSAFAEQVKEMRASAAETQKGKLRPDQLQNLFYQGGDIIAQLGSGSPLGMIALQQGPQIAGVFGPGTGPREVVSGVAQAIGKLITPLTVTATAITAAAATFAYAASSFSSTQREVRASVTGIGRLSGATPQMINEAAESSARAGQVPVSTARQIGAIYASTGRVAPQFFDDLIKVQRDYAAQTKQDIIPSAEELAGALSNVSTGVDLIESRIGPLGNGAGEAAKKLAAAGDQIGAVKLVVEALPGALSKANDTLSTSARIWESITSNPQKFLDLIGGSAVGTDARTGAQRRLDEAQAQIDKITASQRQYGSAQSASLYEATLREERRKLEAARVEVEKERMAVPTAQVDARASQASRVSAALNPDLMALEQARALRSQLEASLRDAVRTDVVPVITGGAGNAFSTLQSLNQQIELLEKNYKAGGEAAATALKQADFEKKIAGLSDYERALEAIRRKFEILREAASKSGDAATREQRIATYNAQETAEVATLGTQTRIRARGQIEIPADYFAMIRAAESSGNDRAVSETGAVGRYQFTKGTWLEIFKKEKDALYADIQSKYADPAGRDRKAVERDVLALRTDPSLQEDLARALTYKNAGELAGRGIEISSRNLYGAHNIGVGGISALVRAQREGQGSVTAQSVLDPIDADLVRGNRAYYGNGKTVDEALATLQRKTLGNSAEARASRERVQAIEGETRALGQNLAQQERATAINEQLRAARERGEEIGLRFKNADELQAAMAKGLTGDLKAQAEAYLTNADARERAVRTSLSTRFEKDMESAYGGLGRTPDEQAAYQQARFYEVPGTAEFDATYSRLRDLQTLVETKSTASGFLKDMVHDLQRGTSFASALSGALGNLGSRLTDKALDSVAAGLFGSAGGKGGSGDWISAAIMSAKSSLGFSDGGYTGAGGRYDVAGYVHAGEVVFSQEDVARHGGVGAVEALRRSGGLRGYADGGIVGREAFTMPRSAPPGTFGGAQPMVFSPNIITPPGYEAKTREVADGQGGRRPEIYFEEITARGIRSERGQQALGQRKIAQR